MTKIEALIGLNLLDIGYIRLRSLLTCFSHPQDIFSASLSRLIRIEGISLGLAEKICSFRKEAISKELGYINKHGLKIITILDDDYPVNLKEIHSPPILLYIRGKLKKNDRLGFAIVGSRRASFYGLSCAQKFAYQLAGLGLTIISGMARGIDTMAHQGALRAKQRTIAVIGSGFNYIYPAENKRLAEVISENGAIISEFPCNTRPLAKNFPRRNRIVSGLSTGLLVVEAAQNSGALITADFALDQGREVFCLPGKIDSETSFGTNRLIKEGAKLVSSIEDILEELGLVVNELVNRHNQEFTLSNPRNSNFVLTENEKTIYNLIFDQPLPLDDLLGRTRITLPKTLSSLLNLELKGLVRQMPGKQFVRSR